MQDLLFILAEMKLARKVCSVLSVVLILLSCVSCKKEGDVIYIEIDETEEARDMIFFVSKKGYLGDIGYVDEIYRGVVKGANSCNLMVSLVELPTDSTKTASTLEYMLDYMQNDKKDRKALVVIANDNLEPLLHKYEFLLTKAPNVDFLLCESSDTTLPIYSLRIPQYGAYYQAGMLASEGLADADSILIVNANPNESNIGDMSKGFSQAIKDYGAETYIENTYLSETSGGYDLASYIYQQSYEIDKTFDLVIPLCGGTAQGFYRYNRENKESFYTIGVDSDMQLYSPRVPFSVVKHLDSILESWIYDWWKGDQTIPEHQELGLESGSTGIIVADSYKERLGGIAEKYYDIAVKKEREYENHQ